MRREACAREMLDGPVPVSDLAATLDDIDRLNRWFGGHALTLREIQRVARRTPADRGLTVIDVGGGRGDFARRVVRWSRAMARPVRVVVVDRDEPSLRLGVDEVTGHPEIRRVCADATALPLREGAADVVTCSLLLHHLDPDAAVASLAEMSAASRDAVVVNDLWRTWWSWAVVWLTTRLFARHRFSRHDGPLSVRRAYAPAELRTLAEKARVAVRIVCHPFRARVTAVSP